MPNHDDGLAVVIAQKFAQKFPDALHRLRDAFAAWERIGEVGCQRELGAGMLGQVAVVEFTQARIGCNRQMARVKGDLGGRQCALKIGAVNRRQRFGGVVLPQMARLLPPQRRQRHIGMAGGASGLVIDAGRMRRVEQRQHELSRKFQVKNRKCVMQTERRRTSNPQR